MMQSLDVRGLRCPLPVLKIRRAMQEMKSGEQLEVLASDPGTLRDVPDYCSHSGNRLLEQDTVEEACRFLLEKV